MKTSSILLITALLFLLPAVRAAHAADAIFWEAESSEDTSMTSNGIKPFTPEEAAKLSGGIWLCGKIADIPLYAHYTVDVPAEGTYHFYARKYWNHGAFRWRFDEGSWTEVRTKLPFLDTTIMRQYVPLNWVQLGDVPLTAGKHKVEIEIINDPAYEFNKYYGFDCFLLTTGEWQDYIQSHPSLSSGSASGN